MTMGDWDFSTKAGHGQQQQPWLHNPNHNFLPVYNAQNGIAQISAATGALKLEESNSFPIIPMIVQQMQELCTNLDNINKTLQAHIRYISPEINNNGMAIQKFDEGAISVETCYDKLQNTFTQIRNRFTVESQSNLDIKSEPNSPAPASMTQDSTSDRAKCEFLRAMAHTSLVELELVFAQSRVQQKPQQITQANMAVPTFVRRMNSLYSHLHEMRENILEKLAVWKGSRTKVVEELNEIQTVYREIFEINQNCRNQVSRFMAHLHNQLHLAIPNSIRDLQKKFLGIRLNLISKSLVIADGPSRVFRTGNNFKAIVRNLLEKSAISISSLKAVVVTDEQMAELNRATQNASLVQVKPPPYVKVGSPAIATEDGPSSANKKPKKGTAAAQYARSLAAHAKQKMVKATPKSGDKSSVELCIHFGKSATDHTLLPAYKDRLISNELDWAPGNDLTAAFEKAKVAEKHLKRDKQGDSVIHEKFYMIFHTEVVEIVDGKSIKVWVWAATPKSCRITTNKVQDVQAVEDIIWSDGCDMMDLIEGARSKTRRETLPWDILCPILRDWLCDSTNIEISPEHMNSLRTKLLSYPTVVTVDGQNIRPKIIPRGHITRNQFSKTKLPDKKFTFWEWLFAIPKLITDHLLNENAEMSGPFEDKKISFISRAEAEKRLKGTPKVTFILRFSDAVEAGSAGIAIGFVDASNTVQFRGPLLGDWLKTHPLATYIMACKDLKYLLPDISKESEGGFEKYIVKDQPKIGYAKTYQAFFSRSKGKGDAKASESDNPKPSTSSYQEPSSSREPPTSTGMAQMAFSPNYSGANPFTPPPTPMQQAMTLQACSPVQGTSPNPSTHNSSSPVYSPTVYANIDFNSMRNTDGVGDTAYMTTMNQELQHMEYETELPPDIVDFAIEHEAPRSHTEAQLPAFEVLTVQSRQSRAHWSPQNEMNMDGTGDYSILQLK